MSNRPRAGHLSMVGGRRDGTVKASIRFNVNLRHGLVTFWEHMGWPLIQILLVVGTLLPLTLGVALNWVKSENPRWRPFLPGLLATSAGLSMSIATYLWVFEDGLCSNAAAFTCRMNENQGILTLLSVVLAVIALWATALTRMRDRSDADDAAAKKFAEYFDAAVGEVRHNLIHVAMAFDDDRRLKGMPQIQVSRLEELNTPDFRGRLERRARSYADATVRNVSRVEGVEVPSDGSCPEELQHFIQTSLLLLNRIITSQPDHPAWLHRDRMLRDMVGAMNRAAPCPYFSSQVKGDIAQLRTEGLPVFCWWEDADLPGVQIVQMGQRVRDYQVAYMREGIPSGVGAR